MKCKSQELKSTLTGQPFDSPGNDMLLLDKAKALASSYASITEGIAVLSDFCRGICYTYSGKFGQRLFSLPEYSMDANSPFEDVVFNGILREDLLERHILELRFFNFIHKVPQDQRTDYQMACILRFQREGGKPLTVLHTSRYISWDGSGNVWLGLCTYAPMPLTDIPGERIIYNSITGEAVTADLYTSIDPSILSRRQTEILALLAKGGSSKQVARSLNISVHTVNRHRQDILTALKVSNTPSAVEIALRLHLI